jgi:predicted peptidase
MQATPRIAKFLTIGIYLLLLSLQLFSQSTIGQYSHIYKGKESRIVAGKYLLYLPADYGKSKEQYPLIMYLHGGSLRGTDVEKLRTMGLPALLEEDKSFPFVVVSPLCPAGEIWTDTDMLIGIMDEVTSKYRIDKKRVYLTGHSMGGRGTWYLAYKYPERFAAIAPMSPVSTITFWTSKLKDMPIWAFHGAKDNLAPIEESESLVKALKTEGGNIKFTTLPDRDHFILDMYEDKQIYQWFLQHKGRTVKKSSK